MTLWKLLQAVVLFVNSVAILDNKRFLEKYGWGFSQLGGNYTGQSRNLLKSQIIGWLHFMSYFRWPLIFLNSIIIFVKLIFG